MNLGFDLLDNTTEYSASLFFVHEDSLYRGSAVSLGEKCVMELRVPRRIGAGRVSMRIYPDGDSTPHSILAGTLYSLEGETDLYRFYPEFSEVGLYFCFIEVDSPFGKFYSRASYDGLRLTREGQSTSEIQITVYDRKYPRPKKISGGVMYHVFVDRFCRKDTPENPNVLLGEWEKIPEYPEYPGAPLKNTTLYGGTLNGVTEKLDYLCSLGVSSIYLSPVFLSPSNHKYDTSDYMQVDPCFGGDEALAELIREAKKRDISIILDGVFNHTGADSVYFNKFGRFNSLGAYQSRESEYFSWFDFKSFPEDYTCWWGIEILPRINPDVPECREFLTGRGGVVEKYRKMGVYGLRLDVCDELSDEFVTSVKDRLSEDGESILYGEVWEDASNKIAYGKRKRYYLGDELDGVMNYPLRKGLIDYIVDKSADSLRYALTEVYNNAPREISSVQMNILGTHDTERILTVLAGAPSLGKSNSVLSDASLSADERALGLSRLAAAYTLLCALPGIPTVFYGDEAGLEGYSDPFNRMPYPWGEEDKSLLAHYKLVGSLRRENEALRNGEFRVITLTEELLVFERVTDENTVTVIYNNSDKPVLAESESELYELLSGKSGKKISVPGEKCALFVLKS